MRSRLKLRQLRLIVEIDRHGSILGAARALGVSQPAATKFIKDIELDLGVELFERTNRGAFATPHGAALVRHGQLVLAQLEQAAQEIDDLSQGRGGKIAVGTLLTASARLLPRALARLAAERPGVRVSIKGGTNDLLMPLLERGELDFVVGRLPEYRYRRGLTQERLIDDRLAVVARTGHPLAEGGAPTLETLGAYPFVLQPHETTARRQIERRFADAGLDPPHATVETVSFLTMRAILSSTDMLAILPSEVTRRDVELGVLVEIRCEPLFAGAMPVGVSYRTGGILSPAAMALLAALRIEAEGGR
ncbi:hypothetical protein OCGS_0984 [Oceaniovalibus guishaninsula JLT2003]|uniref:HTH lysR-type domain-containing protein n=1 Tax=Oceaniovalibus guishaninsula JLT2003 TaxID=1231392 RepID=K2HQ39_9RHOB|nr:LysR substrate-binding domain-containing protein [Oceaniovalibus guishaninsula]EKE44949.1 hypothetical protein OCGS_0984 [Oceaniovalibus guishaninsula JLT2003]